MVGIYGDSLEDRHFEQTLMNYLDTHSLCGYCEAEVLEEDTYDCKSCDFTYCENCTYGEEKACPKCSKSNEVKNG